MNSLISNFMFFSPFDGFMFSFVPILVTIGFVVIISMFIIAAIKGVKQWNYNNAQPILIVDAEVVSKRANVSVSHHHHNNDHAHHHTSTSTSYYITFQVESGDRMEFHVPDREYGQLIERDRGKLKFQGTRYLGFERLR